MRIYLYIIVAAIGLQSCASVKVKTDIPIAANRLGKLVMFPIYIGEVKQPTFPLFDAGIFNKKTNKIASEIMDLETGMIKEINAHSLAILQKIAKIDISSLDLLATADQYSKLIDLGSDKRYLDIDDDAFPILISSNERYHPFPFEDGKVVDFFSDPINYNTRVQEICNILNVDGIAVQFMQLNVIGVGVFGTSGQLRLDIYLFVIDKEGNLVGQSKVYAKPDNIKGKDLSEYAGVLRMHKDLFVLLAKDIVLPKK